MHLLTILFFGNKNVCSVFKLSFFFFMIYNNPTFAKAISLNGQQNLKAISLKYFLKTYSVLHRNEAFEIAYAKYYSAT